MGSVSALAAAIFLLFLIPVSCFKIGYDFKIRLIKHNFSLPLEIKKFYLPVLLVLIALTIGFSIFCEFNYLLLDGILFGFEESHKPSIKDFANVPTLSFVISAWIFSGIAGWIGGYCKQSEIREHIKGERPLFELPDISFFGLWSAFIFTHDGNVNISLDILIDGDLLYSGDLYHFEADDSGVQSFTLKNTKRFLEELKNISGKNEQRYLIPGELTYFPASKIKNINILRIVKEDETYIFWGENTNGVLDDNLERALQKIFDQKKAEIVNAPQKSTAKTVSNKKRKKLK